MKIINKILLHIAFWLGFNFGERKYHHGLNLPSSFDYTKAIYDYSFVSEHNLSIKASLSIAKELIKIATKHDIGSTTSVGQEYAIDIQKLIEDYKLHDKDAKSYHLVSWLHYHDENKKDYFHYDQSFVYYYIEQVQAVLEIYEDDSFGNYNCHVAALVSILDHLRNSRDCIASYILANHKENEHKH